MRAMVGVLRLCAAHLIPGSPESDLQGVSLNVPACQWQWKQYLHLTACSLVFGGGRLPTMH